LIRNGFSRKNRCRCHAAARFKAGHELPAVLALLENRGKR
jgi:hypothetical protein